jgi:hypothetical protein
MPFPGIGLRATDDEEAPLTINLFPLQRANLATSHRGVCGQHQHRINRRRLGPCAGSPVPWPVEAPAVKTQLDLALRGARDYVTGRWKIEKLKFRG